MITPPWKRTVVTHSIIIRSHPYDRNRTLAVELEQVNDNCPPDEHEHMKAVDKQVSRLRIRQLESSIELDPVGAVDLVHALNQLLDALKSPAAGG